MFPVIIIHIDALRRDYVSLYNGPGQELNLTPSLKMLLKESIVYDNAYTPFYGTDPVVTSVMSGLSPPAHGILRHGHTVTSKEKLLYQLRCKVWLPEIFRKLGYYTVALDLLGRWHRRGYLSYHLPLNRITKLSNTVKALVWRRTSGRIHLTLSPPTPYPPANSLIRYIRKLVRKWSRRLFLFIHLWDTHAPYIPHAKMLRKLKSRFRRKGPPISELIAKAIDKEWKNYLKFVSWGAGYAGEVVARYAAAAYAVDRFVKNLKEILEVEGLWGETLLVIYSDHGESLGERGSWFDHHILDQAIIRSIMIIKPPHGIPTGYRVKNLVSLVDIAPSILTIASLVLNKPELGRLAKSLEGIDIVLSEPPEERTIIFGVVADGYGLEIRLGAVNSDGWKYTIRLKEYRGTKDVCPRCGVRHHDREELFNLSSDPQEKSNLASDPSCKNMKNKMFQIVKQAAARHPELRGMV